MTVGSGRAVVAVPDTECSKKTKQEGIVHIEIQENGVHVHISIDEKKFPTMSTDNLYNKARVTLHEIQNSRVDEIEEVTTNGQYL